MRQQTNAGCTLSTRVARTDGCGVADGPRGRPPRFSGATRVPERLSTVGATGGRWGVLRGTRGAVVRSRGSVQPELVPASRGPPGGVGWRLVSVMSVSASVSEVAAIPLLLTTSSGRTPAASSACPQHTVRTGDVFSTSAGWGWTSCTEGCSAARIAGSGAGKLRRFDTSACIAGPVSHDSADSISVPASPGTSSPTGSC